jgi:ATP-dependent metalloprotease
MFNSSYIVSLLARAIAGEANVPFYFCSGSEFEEMFVGVGARRVRDLFAQAKKDAPCIVFIDEIDAVGGTRRINRDSSSAMRMTLNQLLVEMDGFSSSQGLIVIGATNFPEVLDPALVRPGRFDRQVVVPLPDVQGRKEILDLYISKVKAAEDVDSLVLARGTPGCSGADLANIVNVAAIEAVLRGKTEISMELMEYAKDKVMMGSERKSAFLTEEVRKMTAYHEGGHAIVAFYTEGAMPIHKATIIPRGQALGMVHMLPENDQYSVSRKQLLAQLDVSMGGRVAEEMIFGHDNVSTGASSDIQNATRIAKSMVTAYGMSDELGAVDLNSDKENISPDMKKRIDEEVRKILSVCGSFAL